MPQHLKRQAVKLLKNPSPLLCILYKLTKYCVFVSKNEIYPIFILHFSPPKPIINPIFSGKDDGYDPLFLHDEGTAAKRI